MTADLAGRIARKLWRVVLRRDGALPPGLSPGMVGQPIVLGPARLLSRTPPVFVSGISHNEYLGIAGEFARRYGNIPAGFLIFPTWSIETRGFPEAIRKKFLAHRERYPNHVFRFMGNTAREAELLAGVGLDAIFLNKNFAVSDQIFRPLSDVDVEFDAVYNARLVPEKRHELAAAVPRVGYIAYLDPEQAAASQFRNLYAEAQGRNAGHRLLNDTVDGLPVGMSHEQVNAALARASVGLLLSAAEGSSYASMEYLLAGLPVVSTPATGGRDVFFDPDYCIVCEPDPAAVRDAVAELKRRNIPREVVRSRTLAKIDPDRRRFLDMVDDLIESLGGQRRYGAGWTLGDKSGIAWRLFDEHLADFAAGLRSDLAEELGMDRGALEGVQLEAAELRAIVAAVQEKPGCALLVFGCGNDSPFWETVNRGGTTAFVDDDADWAAIARAKLAGSTVYAVDYGTTLANWRRLIEDPALLGLDLPDEISSRRWDVILVDGPAGHDDAQPGRMKSIHAAAGLAAPGGYVFVHDCDRPAERAFATRYLGDDRQVIEVKGRALLRGYRL